MVQVVENWFVYRGELHPVLSEPVIFVHYVDGRFYVVNFCWRQYPADWIV